MNDSNLSKTNSTPQLATDLTRSQNQKPDTWQSTTMLNPSEIESLRQEAQQASEQMRATLASLRVGKA